jgi:energy-coupling factor transporter ATP-binding protein EcfA2
VIRFERFSFTYPGAGAAVLAGVDLEIAEGELCVVVGRTGSGKSTLLRAVNGLVPHFSGGRVGGDVRVAGRSTRDERPRDLADQVGFVGQVPTASFVTDSVEEELAYTMENLGIGATAMRRRIEDVLDLLSLHEVRYRPVRSLSGGQQQRVAIGAVLTASPQVLVLDEPTSALDPAAAEEVLSALARLVHDVGLTVLVAEHRLERVLPFADRVVTVPGDGGAVVAATPADAMVGAPVAPPIVHLGRLAGWSPLPLSVRDARRLAGPLRARLAAGAVTSPAAPSVGGEMPPRSPLPVVATARRLRATYGSIVALRDVEVDLRPGEVTALMGRNGSGKSTLLAHLAGARRPDAGDVRILGKRPDRLDPRRLIRHVGLLPQDPALLLWATTVAEECASADHDAGLTPGTTETVVTGLAGRLDPQRHPRDLSEGQRLGLALGIVLAPAPPVVLLDEPTRGLDYGAKDRLAGSLRALAASGHAVVLATHDVELVAAVADRVVLLADGEVVGDGPARQMVCHSPVFAPQVAKVLAPEPWLTVDEVRRSLRTESV